MFEISFSVFAQTQGSKYSIVCLLRAEEKWGGGSVSKCVSSVMSNSL